MKGNFFWVMIVVLAGILDWCDTR